VYAELHRLAHARLRQEPPDTTLLTTVVVHETYLKLVDQRRASWRSRAHFFASAAEIMRRILVDHARQRHAGKRGGGGARMILDEALVTADEHGVDVLALDEALERLASLNRRQSRLVVLRFFGGLTTGEIADVLHTAHATVERDWATAKLWLRRELSEQ
jgi:RNA polymerase sigma factor (TIGR02999 family)